MVSLVSENNFVNDKTINNIMLAIIATKYGTSGSSLEMYVCIHVRDKGIYSRGI